MAKKKGKSRAARNTAVNSAAQEKKAAAPTEDPKCMKLADDGVRTGKQFAQLMSYMMGDIVTGRMTPQTANAMCNAGGKMLKVVEMQHKYGGAKKDQEDDEGFRLLQ